MCDLRLGVTESGSYSVWRAACVRSTHIAECRVPQEKAIAMGHPEGCQYVILSSGLRWSAYMQQTSRTHRVTDATRHRTQRHAHTHTVTERRRCVAMTEARSRVGYSSD